MRLLERDAGRGARRGHRGPQLVGRVGHELPLLAERSLEPSEQLVERGREAPEFVARIGHREALAQILPANLSGAVRHRHDWREASACEEPAAEPGNDQRNRHDVREDPSQRRQLLVERFHRTAEDHHVVGSAFNDTRRMPSR